MRAVHLAGLLLVLATPAWAQQEHAGHGAPPSASPAPQAGPEDPHAGHHMPAADTMPKARATEARKVPAPPTDHAADGYYNPAEMTQTREILRRENGGLSNSMILFDLAEYQARPGGDGFSWEGEAWFGGDIDKILIKTEGEGTTGEPVENAEVQLLYSHAVAPYWNVHVGLRHDFRPEPSRTYAVLGIEGVAPYWFHLSGQIFLSEAGEFRARAEGSYDLRLTQRLILAPRAEVNVSGQDMATVGVGSGLTDAELGLRLRYEVSRQFAPYVGVEWAKKFGKTARFARAAGEDTEVTSFVAGIRFWY